MTNDFSRYTYRTLHAAQIHFSSTDISTPGDQPDVLVQLLDSSETGYSVIRTGLRAADTTAATEEPRYRAAASEYVLDEGQDILDIPLTWSGPEGLEIEPRILVLTRLIPEADGTSCDQPLESIAGTRYARILRVPFRTPEGEIVPHWISRFEIWPYLERFGLDAERALLAQLGGRPDLIIGNYSDGNLVASLMSHRLGVTQCNIAHALEKTKYL